MILFVHKPSVHQRMMPMTASPMFVVLFALALVRSLKNSEEIRKRTLRRLKCIFRALNLSGRNESKDSFLVYFLLLHRKVPLDSPIRLKSTIDSIHSHDLLLLANNGLRIKFNIQGRSRLFDLLRNIRFSLRFFFLPFAVQNRQCFVSFIDAGRMTFINRKACLNAWACVNLENASVERASKKSGFSVFVRRSIIAACRRSNNRWTMKKIRFFSTSILSNINHIKNPEHVNLVIVEKSLTKGKNRE